MADVTNKTQTVSTGDEYSTENQKKFLQTTEENYNPLLESKPIEKDYQNAGLPKDNIPSYIPEFNFEPLEEPISESSSSSGSHPPFQNSENINPAMNDLSNKDKKIASEMMAEQIIEGYDFIWGNLLTPLAQFNEKKLEKAIVDGEISASISVPISETEEVPIRKFTSDFNENVKKAFVVDEGFKERVRGPLVRVLEKKGLGITDEQVIGLEVLKDSGVKIANILAIRRDIKEIMEGFVERTKEMKTSNFSAPTPQNTETKVSESMPTESSAASPISNPDIVPSNQKEKPIKRAISDEFVSSIKISSEVPMPGMNAAILEEMEKSTNEKGSKRAKKTINDLQKE